MCKQAIELAIAVVAGKTLSATSFKDLSATSFYVIDPASNKKSVAAAFLITAI